MFVDTNLFHSHMGITAVDTGRGDIDTVIKALKESLDEAYAKRAETEASPAP